MAGASFLDDWVRVSLDMPCPVCGKPDWCVVGRDGKAVLCQRKESDWPWEGQSGFVGFWHEVREQIDVIDAEQCTVKLDTDTVTALALKWKYNLGDFDRQGLADNLGVCTSSLRQLCVGVKLNHDGTNKCYTFPSINSDEKISGVSFRLPDGEKRSLYGGTPGVFCNVLRTDLGVRNTEYDTLYVGEGATDAAAFLSEGLDPLFRPSCSGGFPIIISLLERWSWNNVVIVADNDKLDQYGRRPGEFYSRRLAVRMERDLDYSPRIIAPVTHKDARQCIINGGVREYIMSAAAGKSNQFWRVI